MLYFFVHIFCHFFNYSFWINALRVITWRIKLNIWAKLMAWEVFLFLIDLKGCISGSLKFRDRIIWFICIVNSLIKGFLLLNFKLRIGLVCIIDTRFFYVLTLFGRLECFLECLIFGESTADWLHHLYIPNFVLMVLLFKIWLILKGYFHLTWK